MSNYAADTPASASSLQDASGISSTLDFNLGSPERVPGLAAHAAGTGTGTGTPQDKASEGSQSQSPSRNSVELSPAGLVNGPHLPQTPVKVRRAAG